MPLTKRGKRLTKDAANLGFCLDIRISILLSGCVVNGGLPGLFLSITDARV